MLPRLHTKRETLDFAKGLMEVIGFYYSSGEPTAAICGDRRSFPTSLSPIIMVSVTTIRQRSGNQTKALSAKEQSELSHDGESVARLLRPDLNSNCFLKNIFSHSTPCTA